MLSDVRRAQKRKQRVRIKLKKNLSRLRLSVFKSNRHFYVQLINDKESKTVVSASTLEPSVLSIAKRKVNTDSVKIVAALIAERLRDLDPCYQEFVFDKGPYRYIGVLSVFASELRNLGFKF
ncbi:50S ribosomal protein L18 [Neoehrlichia mikurensis]|uniref:Large ribosomal subunit protein uL18 n=1 Tax=Neoehrlichia mikurensis TaxID=89586 RepID=A0A9Q9F3P8_9RICK|nr:50S ribosomal protein L18 [Neoehrlichia mikurensis]QXK91806.1 50S ribosomal protein L18 [Neoehrlichia mikurensis]QXK93019.1 50S ribosomal protein L18 [Neoehrlichia mikurensis]QXK93497.1 50S ribosomal protein L18 [Neoehrlichia mikurensis]UTO55549.1 50S ribosomal protein L18 [Neoehrlichia mikurensis]UTO56470.1 50S ribosomal protein L18 [Neoehrlichia mikurensis]